MDVAEERSADRLDLDDVAATLGAAVRLGGAWSELFVEHRTTLTSRVDDGGLEFRSDRDQGAGVRVGGAGLRGSASTSVLSLSALLAAAEAAAAVRGADATAEVRLAAVLPPAPSAPELDAADTGRRADLLRRCHEAARSEGAAVRSVVGTLVEVVQHVLIATSEGVLVRDVRLRSRMTCRVTARRAGRTGTGFDGPGSSAGLDAFDTVRPEAIGAAAARRALTALDAKPAPSGVMTVVLAAGGGGLLVHEACGHGLEADGVVRGTSVYASTAGTRLAGPQVTLVDDPTVPGAFGTYRVDDEGTPAARTPLIEGGVQVGVLADRDAADRLACTRTANGRRDSAASPPSCRMSNTFLLPGEDRPEDLVGDVGSGVYVSRLAGGEVDVATGEFAFTAAEAYRIERGRLTAPLAGLTLLGTGPAALAGIVGIASDLSLTPALCGVDGRWVPVSYGSPTLRIEGLTVTGARA